MKDLIKKSFLFGIGITEMTKDKVKKEVEEYIKKNNINKEEAKKFTDKVLNDFEKNKKIYMDKLKEEMAKIESEISSKIKDVKKQYNKQVKKTKPKIKKAVKKTVKNVKKTAKKIGRKPVVKKVIKEIKEKSAVVKSQINKTGKHIVKKTSVRAKSKKK